MNVIHVVNPGLLSSIQDAGRPGYSSLGVPRGGAADQASLRLLHSLLGNDPAAAAIETTLTGAVFRFGCDAQFALAGAPAAAWLESAQGSGPVPFGSVLQARAGDTLRILHTTDGARTYLAIAGSIDTPLAMGSRSTHITAGFPMATLQVGEQIPISPRTCPSRAVEAGTAADHESLVFRAALRVRPGPHASLLPDAFDTLLAATFTIGSDSNRAGVRLRSQEPLAPHSLSLLTIPTAPGFVQLPPSGHPIILGRDHPTTGGYPVIASVIHADIDAIGQLRPGKPLRFVCAT